MSFNLNDAPEQTTQQNTGVLYQQAGISDNVRVGEVVLLKTSINQVQYMEIRTIGENGEMGKSNKMFFSQDIKEGKKTSGWGVTANNIINLIMSTHNIEREEAKKFDLGNTPETVVANVAKILVGKPFRAKFKGEQSQTGTLVFATLDSTESMEVVKSDSKLKFDASRDIKRNEYQTQSTSKMDSLPF